MINEDPGRLGYDDWVQGTNIKHIDEDLSLTRVIEVNKNSYIVSDGMNEMPAELSGKLLFDAEDVTDFPTVGDWVAIEALDNNTFAVINSVLPRKTLLKRKEAGKRIDFQLIASNIDYGLIVQSAECLNFNLLDRYFVMLNESKIEPIAVFSKIDLLCSSEMEAIKDNLSKLKNQYLFISSTAEGGTEDLSSSLVPGKTYCLLGQSGVGKTTLLNRLLGTELLKVNEIREKDGKGRHTTARRQLICLDSGAIFIDTPGIRELGNFKIEHGLNKTFEDFSLHASGCSFRDCTHTHEKGCAVIAAVKSGDIEEGRYRNFLKIRKESEYYDMSYQGKRHKDKSFGKMVKNYKNFKKNS